MFRAPRRCVFSSSAPTRRHCHSPRCGKTMAVGGRGAAGTTIAVRRHGAAGPAALGTMAEAPLPDSSSQVCACGFGVVWAMSSLERSSTGLCMWLVLVCSGSQSWWSSSTWADAAPASGLPELRSVAGIRAHKPRRQRRKALVSNYWRTSRMIWAGHGSLGTKIAVPLVALEYTTTLMLQPQIRLLLLLLPPAGPTFAAAAAFSCIIPACCGNY